MNAPEPPTARPASARWWRLGLAAAALAVLGLVFALYAQPGFLVMLVDQLWSCF